MIPTDPVALAGYNDALAGITTNPHGVPEWAARWATGYDIADKHGLAKLPRFATLRRKRS